MHASKQQDRVAPVAMGPATNRWWVVIASASALVVGQGVIGVFAAGVFLKPLSQELGFGRGGDVDRPRTREPDDGRSDTFLRAADRRARGAKSAPPVDRSLRAHHRQPGARACVGRRLLLALCDHRIRWRGAEPGRLLQGHSFAVRRPPRIRTRRGARRTGHRCGGRPARIESPHRTTRLAARVRRTCLRNPPLRVRPGVALHPRSEEGGARRRRTCRHSRMDLA